VSTFRTSDGVTLRFEVVGDEGPWVMVCQGGPNNICDTIRRDLGPLGDSFRMVFHDYRGSGRSGSAPPSSYRFERLADDLDELRAHLGVRTVSVLAHSMGGFVGLQYALRHRDTIDRLALIATTPCGVTRPMARPTLRALGVPRAMKAGTMALRFVLLWSWRPPSDSRTAAMYAPMSVTQEPRRALRGVVARAHPEVPVDNENAAQLMHELGRVDLRPLLPNISCPTLVVYGSRDAVMVAGANMLAQGLRDRDIVVLPDVGHEPFIEAPSDASNIVRRFLLDAE